MTWNGQAVECGYVELESTDGKGQIDGADVKSGKFAICTMPGEKLVRVRASRQIGMTKPDERF